MVQTRNGTAIAATDGSKALSHADRHHDVSTLLRQENVSPAHRSLRDDIPKLLACLVLVGISWAMVLCNIVINIRNGQRLSIDDHGWLMNGVIIGTLSLAPTAAVGFAGYHWARGRRALSILAILAAVPLVAFNLWSTSEYVGDQMLGRQQLQEQRFTSDQKLAELSNAEVMRSKREAEATLWKAWAAMRDQAEKTRIEKQLNDIRSEPPALGAAMEAGTVGARASLFSRRWGWDNEAIEAVTPMAVPVLMQLVELMFNFLGFRAWPRKQPTEPPVEFDRIRPEFSVDDAPRYRSAENQRRPRRHEAEQGRLRRAMGRATSTAWSWLQRFKSEGLIYSVATGMRNVAAIRCATDG